MSNLDDCTHPAQYASFASVHWVKQKNKEAWLDLFAEDAVVQDPVGCSRLDRAGRGHKGREEIGRFWDSIVAGAEFEYTIYQSFPCGDECATYWHAVNRFPDGTVYENNIIGIYKVNKDGKLVSLKAFWDGSILDA